MTDARESREPRKPGELHGVPGRDFGVEDVRGEFPGEIEVQPLEARPEAEITVPGSKSVTNRALIVAALADGTSTLKNPLFSDDSFWLMKSLSDLGFDLRVDSVKENKIQLTGQRGIIPRGSEDEEIEVFIGNAGTAARFLPPALALGGGVYRVDGVERMRQRPVSDLVDGMRALGARVDYAGEEGRFPLRIPGGGFEGGEAKVEGGKSSQFLSGLMISAPYARGDVRLGVVGGLVSRPYVEITAGVMRSFGVSVGGDVERGGLYLRPDHYRAREYQVEPDASGASYFFAVAALLCGRVMVSGLGAGSPQGDLRFVEVLEEMGCGVEIQPGYTEVRGPKTEKLRGVEVDMNEISDTFMTLAAIAPFAKSPTVIKNIEHTRHQETDRISAVATELTRLGVEVEESESSLKITPGGVRVGPAGVSIETYDDHRIAMSFALVGLKTPGIRIKNPSCVTKTMPDYFDRLELLRGEPTSGEPTSGEPTSGERASGERA